MTWQEFGEQFRGLGPQARAFARTGVGRAVFACLGTVVLLLTWMVWPYLAAAGDIRAGLAHQPSRLWGVGETVAVGDELTPGELGRRLEALGFRIATGEPIHPWTYAAHGDAVVAYLPARPTPEGLRVAARARIAFAEGRVADIATEGPGNLRKIASLGRSGASDALYLGAPLLASYYGEDVREIRPVEMDGLPPYVVDAVLAAEDRDFYRHAGLSPTGIARAAWVNLRRGEVEQGGSTITQQLVKNIYLSQDRSFVRKVREVPLSLLVELGHSKRDILQGYLNQIYLGTGHGLNIHGIGSAALYLFGVEPRDLTLGQAATLAGMIRSPGDYSPLRDAAASRERRAQVLAAMLEHGMIEPEAHQAALAEPVEALGLDLGQRRAPHFADAMAAEARERFGIRRLGDRGMQLFSTLALPEQAAAQRAVGETLRRLPARRRLEAALVSADPRDGAIRAWVGGRDYAESEFDRVRQARRQAGSAFKPVVLAAALASGRFSPATRLQDRPLVVRAGGRSWRPGNADGRFRGPVTVRRAIEESLNVPTVRLAQAVGLGAVTAMARTLGIEGRLDKVPSLALGAFEVSPYELATVYATFAADGVRPRLHGLAAVTDARGRAIVGEAAEGEAVLDPAVVYQVTSVLEGVVASGTARGAGRFGVGGPLAAKTGTSNEARDNWFAAYRPDRVTVVWVGHDDPAPTPLSGARAALPIWGSYAAAAYPPPPPRAEPPAGITFATVCRDSGRLPRKVCPRTIDEAFLPGEVPTETCDLHRPGMNRQPRAERKIRPLSWLERKLKKIFD